MFSVRFCGSTAAPTDITSNAPRDSVLRFTLFFILIDNLDESVCDTYLHIADDTKLSGVGMKEGTAQSEPGQTSKN